MKNYSSEDLMVFIDEASILTLIKISFMYYKQKKIILRDNYPFFDCSTA